MSIEPFSTPHRMLWSRLSAVALIAGALLLKPPAAIPPWLLEVGELVGLVLLAVACCGRIWSLVFVIGKKNAQLVTEGPYSAVRNPLYVFSFIGAVGFGLAAGNPTLALVVAALFAAYYRGVVRHEEQFLAGAFGDAFRDYAARVPRWWPDPRRYHEPDSVTLCPRRLRRGIVDAMWFIWAFVLWEIVEWWRAGLR